MIFFFYSICCYVTNKKKLCRTNIKPIHLVTDDYLYIFFIFEEFDIHNMTDLK